MKAPTKQEQNSKWPVLVEDQAKQWWINQNVGHTRIMSRKEKCKQCHHDCHCKEELHSDEYGLCACEECKCKKEFSNKDFWKVMSSRFNK